VHIFGFSYLPPMKVFIKLSQLAKARNSTVAVVKGNAARTKADILVFLSVKDFYAYFNVFIRQKAVSVVFDSALRLADISGINLLDSETMPAGVFMTKKVPLLVNYRQIVASPKVCRDTATPTKASNVISALITVNTKDRFLNPFTSFIYSTPAGPQRNLYKSVVLDYLVGEVTLAHFDKVVIDTFKRKLGKSSLCYKDLRSYLTSKVGLNFIKAMKLCHGSSDPKIYDTISKRLGVDAYEIRYCNIARAQMLLLPTTHKQRKGE
jgi:hypothetical protein